VTQSSEIDARRGSAEPLRILLLPGWRNSGADHWQTWWEQRYGYERVEQADWEWPLRGDWMARLDEVIGAQSRQTALVAHSLGCHLVAAWAAHSRHVGRVRAALLVAPPDIERAGSPPNVGSWRPMVVSALPFASHVVASSDDPYCDPARARALAGHWGGEFIDIGPLGHINGDAALGAWDEGHALLLRLLERAAHDR
jgi:predicted alpha/beta hydrolase family esterase